MFWREAVVTLCLILHTAYAQNCTLPSVATAHQMPFCFDVVQYPFLVPAGVPISEIDKQAASTGSNSLFYLLPETCKPYLKKLICASAFTMCAYPNLTPVKICSSLCTSVAQGDALSVCPGPLLVGAGLFVTALTSPPLNFNLSTAEQMTGPAICALPIFGSNLNGNTCNQVSQPVLVEPLVNMYTNTSGVCYGLIPRYYSTAPSPLTPAGYVYPVMEATAAAQLKLIPAWFNQKIQDAIRILVCNTVFMNPQPAGLNIAGAAGVISLNYYLPQFLCRSSCVGALAASAPFWQVVASQPGGAALIPNCSGLITNAPVASFNGLPSYPVQSQLIITAPPGPFGASIAPLLAANPASTTSTCNVGAVNYASLAALGINAHAPVSCPAPLVIPDNIAITPLLGPSNCALPCPFPLASTPQVATMQSFQTGLIIVGILPTIYILLTFTLFKKKREQFIPARIVYSCFILQLGFYIVDVAGLPKSHCMDNSLGWRQAYAFTNFYSFSCMAQAVCLLFGGLSACFWWWSQAFYMYLKIVHNMKDKTLSERRVRIFMNVISLGYPLLVVALMIGFQQLGFRTEEEWCFVLDMSLDSVNNFGINRAFYFVWPLFYAPVALLLISGTILLLAIFWEILKVKLGVFKAGETNKLVKGLWTSSKKRAEFWAIYRTPVLFLFVFSFIWAFIFAYRLTQDLQYTVYTNSANQWVQCLLTNHNPQDVNAAQAICGSSQPIAPPLFLQYMIQIVVIGTNILVTLVWGTSSETLDMWAEAIELQFGIRICKRYKAPGKFDPPSDESGGPTKASTTTRGHKATKQKSEKTVMKSEKATEMVKNTKHAPQVPAKPSKTKPKMPPIGNPPLGPAPPTGDPMEEKEEETEEDEMRYASAQFVVHNPSMLALNVPNDSALSLVKSRGPSI